MAPVLGYNHPPPPNTHTPPQTHSSGDLDTLTCVLQSLERSLSIEQGRPSDQDYSQCCVNYKLFLMRGKSRGQRARWNICTQTNLIIQHRSVTFCSYPYSSVCLLCNHFAASFAKTQYSNPNLLCVASQIQFKIHKKLNM